MGSFIDWLWLGDWLLVDESVEGSNLIQWRRHRGHQDNKGRFVNEWMNECLGKMVPSWKQKVYWVKEWWMVTNSTTYLEQAWPWNLHFTKVKHEATRDFLFQWWKFLTHFHSSISVECFVFFFISDTFSTSGKHKFWSFHWFFFRMKGDHGKII